jgi:hypothetical protein
MKHFIFYLTCLLLSTVVHATGGSPTASTGLGVAHAATPVSAGAVCFQFNRISSCQEHKDSVLIIFDRFDHTGAGVIFKVFTADSANCINIPEVPAGKYFVTIQCLGLHHDRLDKLVSIKSNKNEKVRIDLKVSEAFSKDNVVIPTYCPKFADLAILKSK